MEQLSREALIQKQIELLRRKKEMLADDLKRDTAAIDELIARLEKRIETAEAWKDF